MTKTAHWSSTFGYILATAGAAIGLGNLWKFPYLVGEQGGALFIGLYLFFVAGIGFPLLLLETTLGRLEPSHPTIGLKKLSRLPTWIGASTAWTGMLVLFMILGFYSVFSSISFAYIEHALLDQFTAKTPLQISALWDKLQHNTAQLVILHGVFIGLTLWITAQGVVEGIERACKWMMPLLFFILILLVGFALEIGDVRKTVDFLLIPNWERFSWRTPVAALGQAFFTLAVGAGCMYTYGNYIDPKIKLVRSLGWVTFLNVSVAMFAGFAIFPLVFHYNLSAAAGPGLMYIVLPNAFAQIAGGQYIALLFFVLLFLAALTSAVSLVEPLMRGLMTHLKISRVKSAWVIGVLGFCMGMPTIIALGAPDTPLSATLYRMMIDIPSEILLPLSGLGFTLIGAYGVNQVHLNHSLQLGPVGFAVFRFLIKVVTPIGIIAILGQALWKMFLS